MLKFHITLLTAGVLLCAVALMQYNQLVADHGPATLVAFVASIVYTAVSTRLYMQFRLIAIRILALSAIVPPIFLLLQYFAGLHDSHAARVLFLSTYLVPLFSAVMFITLTPGTSTTSVRSLKASCQ